jgi:hypothetical protein
MFQAEAEADDHGVGALRRLRACCGADDRTGPHPGVARVRDGVGGRVTAGRVVARGGDPGRDDHHQGGDRHRQRLARRRRRGRPFVPPHRGCLPRTVPARRRDRPSRVHRHVPLALPDAGRVPRRARRRGGAGRAADSGGARAEGAAAGREAHGRRAPLPGHARAFAPGPRNSRRGQAPRARAARRPGSGPGPCTGYRPPVGAALPALVELHSEPGAARLHRAGRGRRGQRPPDRRARRLGR